MNRAIVVLFNFISFISALDDPLFLTTLWKDQERIVGENVQGKNLRVMHKLRGQFFEYLVVSFN